ncbi:hypothetical protein ACNJX9_34545 [Bradyrhizobium sp. DASA03076]
MGDHDGLESVITIGWNTHDAAAAVVDCVGIRSLALPSAVT